MTRLAATLLYVPADRGDRVAKALGLDADVVIVDLEDAVAPAAKEAARRSVPDLLGGRAVRRVQVRVNSLETPWGFDDLAMVRELDAHVEVRLPKVESPEAVDEAIDQLGPTRPVHCLIETAVGVERAFDIARHPQTASIGLGEEDLRSQLGVSDDRGLDWARGRLLVAAKAAGLPPPVQSVYTNVNDLAGLTESCRVGRAMGLVGRCAIHPRQLPAIRAGYRPGLDEIGRARDLLNRLEDAEAAGAGVSVLGDGTFVDAAMVDGARRVLQLESLASAP